MQMALRKQIKELREKKRIIHFLIHNFIAIDTEASLMIFLELDLLFVVPQSATT